MFASKRWKRVLAIIVGVGIVSAVVLVVQRTVWKSRRGETLVIATATAGGTYYPLGRRFADILATLPDHSVDRAVAEATEGSLDNIGRLRNASADVAFIFGPALSQSIRDNQEVGEQIEILARLYRDVVLLAVRTDAEIGTVTDLENRRVYVGSELSGTRMIVSWILEINGLSEGDYMADDAPTYSEAAARLVDGRLPAAFIMAGLPAPAVQTAMRSGKVTLVSLDDATLQELLNGERQLGLVKEEVPANLFMNQPDRIRTVGADVFLTTRHALSQEVAVRILGALFDNIRDLFERHPRASDIKVTHAFDSLPKDFRWHAGAERFRANEEDVLLVATGAVGGKYFDLGQGIQSLLNARGVRARVVQTDGSIENAELLASGRPTVAIMQYDAALAARLGEPGRVYNVDVPEEEVGLPTVENLRRLAVLHDEKLHVVMRRDRIEELEERLPHQIATLSDLAAALKEVPSGGAKLRVCLGPERGATRRVAQAVLAHHKIPSSSIIPSFLSVSDMVDRMLAGEIDAGFFVSFVPAGAFRAILDDSNIRLLSLGNAERARMVNSTVFDVSTIDAETYASQQQGEPAIQTISTKAVLVTAAERDLDVGMITEAVFKEAAYLGIAGGIQTMKTELSSLPLHPSAMRYYQRAGLRPSDPRIEWLKGTYYFLAIVVVLLAGYRGVIKLRRDKTFNAFGRQILAVRVDASVPGSVQRLLNVRDEIQERVRKRWWQLGELDKRRWRYLYDMIDDRMREAKENLARRLVAEMRDIPRDCNTDDVEWQRRREKFEQTIWAYIEQGELDKSQHEMLRDLAREARL